MASLSQRGAPPKGYNDGGLNPVMGGGGLCSPPAGECWAGDASSTCIPPPVKRDPPGVKVKSFPPDFFQPGTKKSAPPQFLLRVPSPPPIHLRDAVGTRDTIIPIT